MAGQQLSEPPDRTARVRLLAVPQQNGRMRRFGEEDVCQPTGGVFDGLHTQEVVQRLRRHGFGGGGGAGAAGAPPPISVLRMPNDKPASAGDLPGSGTAASSFCQAWQPSVLNVLSVGSIFTICGFLLMALSIGCFASSPSRFQ